MHKIYDVRLTDSRTQNTLGRISRLLSILSYIESLYIHLLIYVRLAIAVPLKIT